MGSDLHFFFGAVLSIFDATEGTLGMRARVRCSPVTPRRGPPAARSGYVHPAGLRTGRSRDAATVKKEKKGRKKNTRHEGSTQERSKLCTSKIFSRAENWKKGGGGIIGLSSDFLSLACAAAHRLGMRCCERPVTPAPNVKPAAVKQADG